LESEGFEVQCFLIPASGIGAWHQRNRVWIIGHSKHNGLLASEKRSRDKEINGGTQEGQNQTIESERTSGSRNNEDVSNTEIIGTRESRESDQKERMETSSSTQSNSSSKDVSNTTEIGSFSESIGNFRSLGEESQKEKGGEWSKPTICTPTRSSKGTKNDVQNSNYTGLKNRTKQFKGQPTQKEERIGSLSGSNTISNTIGKLSDGCSSTTRDSDKEFIRLECNEGWDWQKVWSQTERCSEQDVSHSNEIRLQGRSIQSDNMQDGSSASQITSSSISQQQTWWTTFANLCGIPDGISYGLDKDRTNRIKSLGNAIVPQCARIIGLAIKKVLVEENRQ